MRRNIRIPPPFSKDALICGHGLNPEVPGQSCPLPWGQGLRAKASPDRLLGLEFGGVLGGDKVDGFSRGIKITAAVLCEEARL